MARELEGDGFLEAAHAAYREMYSEESAEAIPAAVALARLALEAGRDDEALAVLAPVVARVGLEALPPEGLYHYGVALEAAGRLDEAAGVFAAYGQAVPAMADTADMAVGNVRFAAGNFEDAAEAFERARDRAGDPSTAFLATLRLGNALLRTGPIGAAVAAYEEAYTRAGDDDQRAQALAGLIAVHLKAGRNEDANAVRRRMVRDLPEADLAVSALERLRSAGEPVPPAEEAVVRASAGQHRLAVRLLNMALEDVEDPPGDWYVALADAYHALGEHATVVGLVRAFLDDRPEDPVAPELALLRARALDDLGRGRDAEVAYRELADRWPGDARAPGALWQRARLLEDLDGAPAAAEAYESLAVRYPRAADAADARFRAGLLAWQEGRVPQAAERWTVLSESGNAGAADRARSEYWLGRMAVDLGNPDAAETHWRAAVAADADGFYGLHAAWRLNLPASTPPPEGIDPFGATGQWLATWRPEASPELWAESRRSVAARRSVARGAAWLALGERRAALRALRAANGEVWDKPVAQAALAFEASDLGLHVVASSAASHVLAVAPPGARAAAPLAFRRLAYPDAYGHLIRAEADANDLPPALLFALVRQESRYEPTALSHVGAIGLTQVMPTTGRQIAARLDEKAFSVDDLYRPHVALRFGAWYLAEQRRELNGLDWPALAAYNGGPANARRWLEKSGGDLDLFVELIDFRETRRFVRSVTEHRAQYERLYPQLQP